MKTEQKQTSKNLPLNFAQKSKAIKKLNNDLIRILDMKIFFELSKLKDAIEKDPAIAKNIGKLTKSTYKEIKGMVIHLRK